ncbi:MAG: phage protease [Victivallaceae bacterium]|nr:phage protease [Victivallaceae bacterium]
MDWFKLSAETPEVIRDDHGVPVEWTILKVGKNPLCQEGKDDALSLSAEDMHGIVDYFRKKGELIPIDSEHYLYELADRKHVDEAEALKLFPGGVAALGYGALALSGENLRIKVNWTPAAYEFMKEKIYKYFSPVIRGLEKVTPALFATSRMVTLFLIFLIK